MTATASLTERLCAAYDLEHPHRDHDARVTRADALEYIRAFSVDKPPDHPTTALHWDLIRTFGESEGRRLVLHASRQWDATPLRARDIVFKWWDDDHEPVAWQDEYLADLIGSWRAERDRVRRCADGEREWEALSDDFYIKQSDYDAWCAKYSGWLCPGTLKHKYGPFKIVPDSHSNVLQFPAAMDKPQMPMPANQPALPAAPLPDLIKTSAEFVAGFVAPSYLLDGILQRQFVYAFTAATGGGKTAIALRLSAHVALGRKLGDRDVARGRVLYFASENSVDVQARWLAMAEHCKFDVDTIDVYFISGATKLSEIADRVTIEAHAIGELALVVVDTSAATFEGSDENSNVDGLQHAKRMRSLTSLRGGPTVLVLCHPVKSATNDNLAPRGGGSFVAEIDGNLVARKGDSSVEVHWSVKFRGMDFAPIAFRLDTVVAPRLKDAKGRPMPTVMATPIDDAGKQVLAASERSDQDRVLRAIEELPGKSSNELAKHLGWQMRDGKPYGVRVRRACERLAGDGLLSKHRGAWVMSNRGQVELNNLDKAKAGTTAVPVQPPFPMPRLPQ